MMRALLAVLVAIGGFTATSTAHARAAHVVISDGFTAKGVAGSQAIIHLSRPTAGPDDGYHGAPTQLRASKGVLAGYALVSTTREELRSVVLEATSPYVCGRSDCGEDAYRRDATTRAPGSANNLLPAGDYYLVLLGSPGATVTVTVEPSSRKHKPVTVPMTARATVDLSDAPGVTAGAQPTTGAQPQDRGSFAHSFSAPRALIAIVYTAGIEYGYEVSGQLDTGGSPSSCYGTSKSFDAAIYNDAGPLPSNNPGIAWSPMYLTKINVAVCTRARTDLPLEANWSASVNGLHSSQRAFGFFVPLVAH